MQLLNLLLSSVNCIPFKLPAIVEKLGLVERKKVIFPSGSRHKSTAKIGFSIGCTYLLPSL